MGEAFVRFYKQRLKKEWKFAFFSTFIITLLIHLYKFANTLPNHDSLYNFYSNQNGLGSGRWALSLACSISSYYDLPWVNGLLCCLFIALTAVVIVALFRLKNPVLIALIGGLLAATPAVTETLFFNYTADGYFMAMFLAALAVWLSRMEEKRVLCQVLSGVCICFSCGIYQSYVSFALVLAVCYFIDVLLQGDCDKKSCWKWVLRQVIIFAVALAVYFLIWKLCMLITGIEPNDYQGIDNVGRVNAEILLGGLTRSVHSTLLYFTQWNILEHGMTLYSTLNLLFLVILGIGMVNACIQSGILKRPWAMVLLVLCCVAVVPFACIWHFTSDEVGYRPMMLTSLVILFALCAILYERWAKSAPKNLVCLFLVLIGFHNAVMANVSYYYMNVCYEQTYAQSVEMMMEIHDFQDEYEIEAIAIVGNRSVDVQLNFFNEKKGTIAPAGKLFILSALLEENLLMDWVHTVAFLREVYDFSLPALGGNELKAVAQNPQVQEMGCWPAGDSMAVIDGVLVLKLSD